MLAEIETRQCDCGLCAGCPDYRASGVARIQSMKRCPECRDGKHQNCDGIADLDDNDNPVPCECDSNEAHPMRVELLDFDTDEEDDDHDSRWDAE